MNWELGEEVVYRDDAGRRNVPLSEATRWPDNLTDRQAEFYVRRVERRANQRLGFTPCGEDHALLVATGLPCPKCGAAL